MTAELIAERLKELQEYICERLEVLDGVGSFRHDDWHREGGGGGQTRIIENGDLIQKGGVNFSNVFGQMAPENAKMLGLPSTDFFATGVSIVLHPNSPMVPIIHMNVRYFESGDVYWFGGGVDLTPHYIEPGLATDFHAGVKAFCDEHHKDFYPKFSKWASEYFYIPHRKEERGIGGIFFDKLDEDSTELTKDELLEFIIGLGRLFPDLYEHQAKATRALPYGERELRWQGLRRGRYVEFNLVYDRGTHFGFKTGGRTESILMSLPATASWEYDAQVEPDSAEEATLNYLQVRQIWL